MKRIDPYLAAEALGFSEKDKNILIALADDLIHERLPDEDWQMTCWSRCICGNMEKRGSTCGVTWEGRIPTGSCLLDTPRP